MNTELDTKLANKLLDILPNPVLVKNEKLEYVWINKSFEELFSVSRHDVIGKKDKELFPHRQVSQCNGGDLRVLENGEIDEATETVFNRSGSPIETITRKIRLKEENAETYLIGVMHDVTEVTRANEALIESQNKLTEQALELAILVNTDAMTGCSNRRVLAICDKNIAQSIDSTAALIAIDVDGFKKINDDHGHACGDAVLRHFCDMTRSLITDNDYFVRLGGEEFALVISNKTFQQIAGLTEKLRKLIADTPILVSGFSLNYTVSIGVSFKDSGYSTTIDNMLRIADDNLYAAKNSGRNKVVLAA